MGEIGSLITNLINFLKWLAAGVGVIMLIMGAIKHQMAQSPSAMDDAKRIMQGSVIGLAIALLAQVIVTMIKGWLPG